MRRVDCIVCQSTEQRTVATQSFRDEYLDLIDPSYQQEERSWVACADCGFVYHDPQLDESDTAVLYDKFRDASFRNETPDAYFDRITSLPAEQSENYAKAEWLEATLPRLSKAGGRILDIGCGGGVFLHTFLQRFPSWQAFGVEPTTAFAELASRRLDRPVIAGAYSRGKAGVAFDLITCNQVLEHTIDPADFLRDIHADLAPGGHLYIEVPDTSDFESLPPEHDRFLMQHLWYFTDVSLQRLAGAAGLETVITEKQVTKRGRNNLVALLRRGAA